MNDQSKIQKIEEKLKLAFTDPKIEVNETEGDGLHFGLTIASKDFAGKSLVEQHKMVYKALGDMMQEEIHALTIKVQIS